MNRFISAQRRGTGDGTAAHRRIGAPVKVATAPRMFEQPAYSHLGLSGADIYDWPPHPGPMASMHYGYETVRRLVPGGMRVDFVPIARALSIHEMLGGTMPPVDGPVDDWRPAETMRPPD